VPDLDPTACEKTPMAIRNALERRPEWQRGFAQDFLSAAGEFDQEAMDAAVNKWFPAACACATPGYMDEIDETVRRINAGETEGMVFWDSEGNAWDADNNPLPLPPRR
jgi:hypothetical protein